MRKRTTVARPRECRGCTGRVRAFQEGARWKKEGARQGEAGGGVAHARLKGFSNSHAVYCTAQRHGWSAHRDECAIQLCRMGVTAGGPREKKKLMSTRADPCLETAQPHTSDTQTRGESGNTLRQRQEERETGSGRVKRVRETKTQGAVPRECQRGRDEEKKQETRLRPGTQRLQAKREAAGDGLCTRMVKQEVGCLEGIVLRSPLCLFRLCVCVGGWG